MHVVDLKSRENDRELLTDHFCALVNYCGGHGKNPQVFALKTKNDKRGDS
jgi:hypothetical protein